VRVLSANQIRALRFVPFPFGFRPSGFGFVFPLCGLCVKIRVHRFLPLPFGFRPSDFGLRFPVVPTLQKSPFFKAFQQAV
jgi:hypothetical protein